MGKALVIKDIDFSQEGLGRVTFINEDSGNTGGGATVVYSINGASSITGASTYVLQPSPSGTVTWTISNSSVATLSSTTGTSVVVTPVANKGQNSIVLTATVGTKTITKNITVISEITGDDIDYSIIGEGINEATGAITYSIQPTPTETVTWSISNTTVATLSSTTGTTVVVTPKANTGTNNLVLTAVVGTKTITKNITVNAPTVENGYKIVGETTVSTATRFYIDPLTSKTVTWSISDTSVATLIPESQQAGIAPAAVVTPIANTGTNSIVLTAVFGTTTLTKTITVIGESSSDETVVITKTSDVVANESLKYYFSTNSTPYKRRAFIYLDIDKNAEWDITIQPKADSPYKYGIQYHASRYISNTDPEKVTLGNGGYVAYDSGWILPGASKTCDETNNKSNTVGGANFTGKPTAIAITATHTSDESIIIDKESYLANIDFTLTKKKANSGNPGDDDLVG